MARDEEAGGVALQMANMTTAMKLLEELRSASFDTAAKELKSLQGFAASQGGPFVPQPCPCTACACMQHARFKVHAETEALMAAPQNFTKQLMNWDVSYFAQLQQQALFNLTDEEVRPYFVYDNVLQGLFQVSPTQSQGGIRYP